MKSITFTLLSFLWLTTSLFAQVPDLELVTSLSGKVEIGQVSGLHNSPLVGDNADMLTFKHSQGERYTPEIVDVMPNNAEQGELLTVYLSGQYTHFAQGSNTVVFQQGTQTIMTGINMIPLNQTLMSFDLDVPVWAPLGLYDIQVQNATDGIITKLSAFEVLPAYFDPPEIVVLIPDSAVQGESMTVFLSGQFTHFSQGSETVIFQQASQTIMTASNITVQSQTLMSFELEVPVWAPIGLYDVQVQNPTDGIIFKQDAFEVFPASINTPQITTITPDSAEQGETLTVTLSGEYTHFTQGSETVFFEQAGQPILTASNISVQSPTLMSFQLDVPNGAPLGICDVKVQNPTDGTITKYNAFKVVPEFIGIPETDNLQGPVLEQNVPNPFSQQTSISYYLPNTSKIELSVYNLLGRQIEVLGSGIKQAGKHTAIFDTKTLPSGIYLYKLEVNGEVWMKRMNIL